MYAWVEAESEEDWAVAAEYLRPETELDNTICGFKREKEEVKGFVGVSATGCPLVLLCQAESVVSVGGSDSLVH